MMYNTTLKNFFSKNFVQCLLILASGMVFLFDTTGVMAEEPELNGEIIEYGYYLPISDSERKANLRSPTGYVKKVKEVKLVQQTADIPMIKGQLFGFRFRISGFKPKVKQAAFSLVVRHPEMVRPNGSRTSGYSYPVTLGVTDGVLENKSGYKFDNDYEMAAGQWRFQYWSNNKMVVEQVFNVKPATEDEIKMIEAAKASLDVDEPKGEENTIQPVQENKSESGMEIPSVPQLDQSS